MAALTSCPRCDVSLLVPAALLTPAPHGRFRCPACESEVDLPEALAAVQKTVLEAIPINAAGEPLTTSDAVAPAAALGATAATTDLATSDESAPFTFKLQGDDAAAAPALGPGDVDDEADGDESHEADEEEAAEFGGIESDQDDEPASPVRHGESSIGGTIRTLVGVVLGGLIGIGGGLLILKAYQGDKFRSPIPLPNITAYLPDFLKPAEPPEEESSRRSIDLRPRNTTGEPITLPPIDLPPDLRRDLEGPAAPATPTATGDATSEKTPAAPKRTKSAAADAMDAPESLKLPAPTVAEEPPVPPTIDDVVQGAPARTVAQVSESLAAAAASFADSPKGSVAIDATHYDQLAAVGQSLALVRAESQVVDVFRAQAAELLRLAVFGKANLDAVSAFGVERLSAAKEANESGAAVVLVGQVQKMTHDREHGYWVFRVAPQTDRDNEIVVLSPDRYGMIEFDRVLVAGAVVAEPSKNVVGFMGKEPQVVWAGFVGRPAQGANAPAKTAPKKPAPTEAAPTPAPKPTEPPKGAEAAGPATPTPMPKAQDKPAEEQPKTPAPAAPTPDAPAKPEAPATPEAAPAKEEKPAAPAAEPAPPATLVPPTQTPEPSASPAPAAE